MAMSHTFRGVMDWKTLVTRIWKSFYKRIKGSQVPKTFEFQLEISSPVNWMYYFASFLLNDIMIKELNLFSNDCMLIASSRCSRNQGSLWNFRMPPPPKESLFLKNACVFSLVYRMWETMICLYFCCFEIGIFVRIQSASVLSGNSSQA